MQYHLAQRREHARVTQLVLRRLPQTLRRGDYPPAIRPFVVDMEREAGALLQHLGGEENVSEVQLALVRDAVIAGATLGVALARVVQTGGQDDEAMAKISGLVGARARVFSMLGLQRVAKEIDLSTYLAQRAERAEPVAELAPLQQDCSSPENGEQNQEVAEPHHPSNVGVEPAGGEGAG